MKVIIIEDEHLTAERIHSLLQGIDPDIQVLAIIDSVKQAVQWFREHGPPDLVFMDIQLADGISFDIFDRVRIEAPVIFITAYQEYAIRAFKVNSVDYLLKPIAEGDLQAALEKYKSLFQRRARLPEIGSDLLASIRQMISKPYKTRFMVKVGDRIKSVDVEHILFFYSQQKGTFIHTEDKRNYAVDYTLDKLGELLDPALFHRINRKYLSSHKAIAELISLSGSKLKVRLVDSEDEQIYVSRDRLSDFKNWLDQ
jgi:two-component system LytT family response regulator